MQITACSPGRLRVSRGNTLAKPTATLLGWYHRLLPSALVRSLRIHKRPADAPESRGDLAGSTGERRSLVVVETVLTSQWEKACLI